MEGLCPGSKAFASFVRMFRTAAAISRLRNYFRAVVCANVECCPAQTKTVSPRQATARNVVVNDRTTLETISDLKCIAGTLPGLSLTSG